MTLRKGVNDFLSYLLCNKFVYILFYFFWQKAKELLLPNILNPKLKLWIKN